MSKISKSDNGNFIFWCPGCGCAHHIREPIWKFNHDIEKPTVTPSIKVTGTIPVTDEEVSRIMNSEKVEPVPFICHSFITDGKIAYCSDTTHKLSGQTVDLPDY